MGLEGNNIGERSADVLMFDGLNQEWITDRNQTKMSQARGGHAAIPITYTDQMIYLTGWK